MSALGRVPVVRFRTKVLLVAAAGLAVFSGVAGLVATAAFDRAVDRAEAAREGEVVRAGRRAIELWQARAAAAASREAAHQGELSFVRGIEPRTDLPLVEVIDRGGTVQASLHRPEAVGGAAEAKLQMPLREGVFLRDTVRGREVVTVQAKVPIPGSAAVLVGGYPVGGELLGELGRAGLDAWVFLPGRGTPVSGTRDPELEPVTFDGDLTGAALEHGVAAGSASLRGVEGPLRAVAIRLPTVGNRNAGTLVAAFPRAPWIALRTTLRRGAGIAAAAGTVAALLVLLPLAVGLTRPFGRFLEYAEALRRGDLDARPGALPRDELGVVGAALRETTARLRREIREHARAARMAAWRDFARKIAHEIKNPLTPIRTSVENLRRARSRGPEVLDAAIDESAAVVLEEVASLHRLADSFSALGRMEEPRLERVDLNALVERTVALFRGSAEGVALDSDLDRSVPEVTADPGQMGQVLKNLVKNALEAAVSRRNGGSAPRVRVATRRVRDSAGESFLAVSVEDNGPGIPEEVRARLFEPYVTSKPGGTGLGLALSFEIVRQHGGRIEAESPLRVDPPEGTRLSVLLRPGAPAPAPPRPEAAP